MIRHARPAPAGCPSGPVLLLAIAVVEPAFRTLLIAVVGRPVLPAAGFGAARRTAIALSAVAMRAQEKHRAAFAGQTKPLP